MSILNPLADLVAWAIIHLHAWLGALFGPDTGLAWGLSIAVLVMIIRLLLVPLFVKQVHAQRKMAQHAPQLAVLRQKYKNDKQRLNEETMKFYKENGVNPLAGCLPMIPQMIVFFSLFYVLRAIAEWTPKVKPAYGLTVPELGRTELCVARTAVPAAPTVAGSAGAQFRNMKYCWPSVHRLVVTQYSTSPYCQ